MPKLLSDLQKATMLGSPLHHDVQWVGATNKDLCLSWSKLEKFEQCPRLFNATYIEKRFPFDAENPILKWGNKVHKDLENYLLKGIQLPTETRRFQAAADSIKSHTVRLAEKGKLCVPLNGEQEWAMTANGKYTTWFDSKNVFMRNKADAMWGSKKVLFSVDWKGLSLDTPLMTPNGFITMADINVGDYVITKDGAPTKVVGKSQVKNIKCYAVTITTGDTITCDEEHLWQLLDGSVVNVKDLKRNDKLPIGCITGTEVTLPIQPYTLGIWLADGTSKRNVITKPYDTVWDNIQKEGYVLGKNEYKGRCRQHGIAALTAPLQELNLIGNKHIPSVYVTSSIEQRKQLVRGLLDGDGYVNTTRREIQFENTNKQLIEDVALIIRSLGIRATLHTINRKVKGAPYTVYRLTFKRTDWAMVTVPHKLKAYNSIEYTGVHHARVISVVEVASVPTQCIKVASECCTYLCGNALTVTHNTGKGKYPKPEQLEVVALVGKAQPRLANYEKHKSALVFLEADKVVPLEIDVTPPAHEALMRKYLERGIEIVEAYEEQEWAMKPSALCAWCDDTTCPYNKK